MQNGTKRHSVRLLAVLLIAVLGCSRAEREEAGKTVIEFSFWAGWGNIRELEMWKAVVAGFEEENADVKVKLVFITGDYHRKLPLQFISNSAADVILMDDEIFPAYAARGYLEDLRPYMERDREELKLDELLPTALDSFTFRGSVDGLPWDGNSVLVFYNKDMFDEAGIAYPTDDWTWDDYRDIARRLTKDLDGDGRLDQFGSNFNFVLIDILPIVWSYGGDLLNGDRTAFALDSPGARQALDLMYKMKYEDHSVAWVGELESFSPEAMLLTGRVGMVPAGSYMMMTLKSVKGGMNWGVAIPPSGPAGRFTRVTWDGICLNAASNPKEKDAGWRFIKHLLSAEGQAIVGRSGRAMPVRRGDVLKYWVQPDTPVEEELALEAIRYGRLTPITPKYHEIRTCTEQEFRALIDQKMTVDTALKRMKPKVDKALRQEVQKWGRVKSEYGVQ